MDKRWSKTEISHLKKNAASTSVEELAHRFHTDTNTVRAKLEALNLTAGNDGGTEGDAALEEFEAGLEKIHAKQWAEAKSLFESVVAKADHSQLSDRARQYIEICLRQEEELSSEDPYLLAVFEKNRGNLEAALAICKEQGKDSNPQFAYLTASIEALAENEDEAIEQLRTAIDLEPKNRVYAYHDPDFRSLHGVDEFTELMELS